jgi:SAM-dependent methyltransferase
MTRCADWGDHQALEASFWGSCANTYGEETKQFLYLNRMGFKPYHDGVGPFAFRGEGKSFLDIGGGPVSCLLKFRDAIRRVVIDPCDYPDWVSARYEQEGILYQRTAGEDCAFVGCFDVVFIYNCLQHVREPDVIINNALKALKPTGELHMFEWVGVAPHPGHPHMLTPHNLEAWTSTIGKTETFNGENECYGTAWFI